MFSRSDMPGSSPSFVGALLLLFVLGLAIALPFNGARSLWDTSETRYGEASREMVAQSEWLVPLIDGAPHLTKPPLAYWMYGGAIKLLGKTETAVRLPCAIFYALSAVFVALAAEELTGRAGIAALAGVLQLASPLALIGSHVVTTDVFLAAEEPAYIWAMLCALHATTPRQAHWRSIGAWLLLAVAFLTKGPPALLSALPFFVFLFLLRKKYRTRKLIRVDAIVIFLIVAAAWYVVVLLRVPGAMEVWKIEALQKVFVDSSRNMPPLYYPLILIGGAFPSVLGLFLWNWRMWRAGGWRGAIHEALTHDPVLLCALWVTMPLVIFMLAKTRLPLYVIPLIAPLNILGAVVLSRQWEISGHFSFRKIPTSWKALAVVIILVITAVKITLALHDDTSKNMRPLAKAIRADAHAMNKQPRLLITMGHMGNGLLFYLDGPPSRRLAKNDKLSPTSASLARKIPGPNRALKSQVFSHAVPAGYMEYIIMDSHRIKRYSIGVTGLYVPIFNNSQWAVWRRNGKLYRPPDKTGNNRK